MNTRYGPSGETRTRGILLPKQARYQLRYTWIYRYSIIKSGALPVVVPGIFVGDEAPSSSADHGHSLGSLASAAGGGRLAPQLRYTWIRMYSKGFFEISQGVKI